MAELGTLEAMAVQGALKAMAELGALGTMAELGALEAMALEAMADGLWGPWPRPPRPSPYSRNPTTPPKKNFPREVRGYQEPSRAKQTGQYKTRQDSPPGPDRQDRTGQNTTTGKPSRARQTRQDIPQEPKDLLG